MKIQHVWSVLCQDSTLNQDDNIISLNKVLEEISIVLTPSIESANKPLPEKINFPLSYEIVSLWLKEKKEEKVEAVIEVVFVSPDGEVLNKATLNLLMPENIKRSRSRIKIAGLPIKKSGVYFFKVRIQENGKSEFKEVSNIPLEVKIEIKKPVTKN